MKTYSEMNEKIKGLLRLGGKPENEPVGWYAAQRIEELEQQNAVLQARLTEAEGLLKCVLERIKGCGYKCPFPLTMAMIEEFLKGGGKVDV
jgi:hypothetical protein